METRVIERNEMPSKMARWLDSKLDSRTFDDFMILPGVSQEEAINRVFPILEDAQRLLGDSIWRCLTDMRYLKLPMGIWDDSKSARQIRNLTDTLDPAFEAKIVEVATLFAKSPQHVPDYFVLNKLSNGGFPHFTNSTKKKIEQFLSGCEMCASGAKLLGVAASGLRVQPESVTLGSDGKVSPKMRKYMYTEQNALDIKYLYGIDITKYEGIRHDGNLYWGEHLTKVDAPFVQPARPRWVVNVDLQTNAGFIATGSALLMPHGVSEAMYVIRGPQDLANFVANSYTTCLDFENFERTVTARMIELIVEVLTLYHPSISHVYECLYDAYFNMIMYGIDSLPNDRGKFTYNYTEMKSDKKGIFGIVSGSGHTSQLGKIIGTAFVAYCLEKVGVPCSKISEYENLMRNCGDDNVVKHFDLETKNKFDAFVLEQDQLKVSLEDPKKYLGIEIKDIASTGLSSYVTMSANSFIENTLCPEREAGSNLRRFAVLGLKQRWDVYSANMPDRDTFALCERFFKAMCDMVPDYADVLAQEEADSIHDADMDEFLKKFGLNKPEEIYYKLDTRKLSKEDLQMIGLLIPKEEVISRIPGILEVPNLQ